MKVWLNLLPQEKKEVMERKRFDGFLLRQALLFAIVVMFHLSLLFGTALMARQDRVRAESEYRESNGLSSEFEELAAFEETFRSANALSDRMNRFLFSEPKWTLILSRLGEIVPSGVTLTSLTTREYRIFVSGEAKTREDFLVFESALKGDDCLVDVEAPVSNLFSETDVSFQVDFSVVPECLLETRGECGQSSSR